MLTETSLRLLNKFHRVQSEDKESPGGEDGNKSYLKSRFHLLLTHFTPFPTAHAIQLIPPLSANTLSVKIICGFIQTLQTVDLLSHSQTHRQHTCQRDLCHEALTK